MKLHSLLLVVFHVITVKGFSSTWRVTQSFSCSIEEDWWVKNYFKILQQSHQLLLLTETFSYNSPEYFYTATLVQNINKHSIIPLTVFEMSNCSQSASMQKSGIIIFITTSEGSLMQLFQNAERCTFDWDNRSYFVIIILCKFSIENNSEEKNVALSIFKKLWTEVRALNVLLVTRNLENSCGSSRDDKTGVKVWIFDPFEINVNDTSRGNIYGLQYGDNNLSEDPLSRRLNLHQFPLTISIFEQYPTAIPLSDPVSFNATYTGMDGSMLSSIIKHFNMNTTVRRPLDTEPYGSVLPNGTILGSLGDVVYRKVDASFNTRFLLQYGTDEVEFSIPIATDKVCIMVPKAKRIPKWKSMLTCFSTEVWLTALILYIACTIYLYVLHLFPVKNLSLGCLPILQMFQVFILSPVHHPPTTMTQKMIFTSCLFTSLILMNIFQGLLVTSITSPRYESDIHTLNQLLKANLPIFSSSFHTRDILRNAGYKISNQFRLYEGNQTDMTSLIQSEAAFTERESSAAFLVTKYVSVDGTTLLHQVEECPTFYHLAYIFPKGSPYLPKFNEFFRRVLESGLTDKWYWEVIDSKTKLAFKKSHSEQKILKLFSLADLQLAFYVIIIGLILSGITFVLECTLHSTNVISA